MGIINSLGSTIAARLAGLASLTLLAGCPGDVIPTIPTGPAFDAHVLDLADSRKYRDDYVVYHLSGFWGFSCRKGGENGYVHCVKFDCDSPSNFLLDTMLTRWDASNAPDFGSDRNIRRTGFKGTMTRLSILKSCPDAGEARVLQEQALSESPYLSASSAAISSD